MSSYLEDVVQQLRAHDAARPRSRQHTLGMSGLGDCRALIGFRLSETWCSDDVDTWASLRGTFLDEAIFRVRAAANPRLQHQVPVTWRGITGRVDEYDPDERAVTDLKTTKLANITVWKADPEALTEKRIQVQTYARALVDAGTPVDLVRLLVAPVDGRFSDWWAYEEPYDELVSEAAWQRLEQVRALQASGEPLPRDKPHWWCSQWCEFFSVCRHSGDAPSDDEVITDPELVAKVAQYGAAREHKAAAEKTLKQLAPEIRGLRGVAGDWRITMTTPKGMKPVLDEQQVRAEYAANGLDVPTRLVPTASPSLRVERVKETR